MAGPKGEFAKQMGVWAERRFVPAGGSAEPSPSDPGLRRGRLTDSLRDVFFDFARRHEGTKKRGS